MTLVNTGAWASVWCYGRPYFHSILFRYLWREKNSRKMRWAHLLRPTARQSINRVITKKYPMNIENFIKCMLHIIHKRPPKSLKSQTSKSPRHITPASKICVHWDSIYVCFIFNRHYVNHLDKIASPDSNIK